MRVGKRGISELVAALILVLIVMAGAIIVYVYSSGLLGSLQGAQPQGGQYSNQIALEYYDWTTTAVSGRNCQNLNCVKLILRNVGTGRGILAAFYVSNSTKFVAVPINATSSCTTTAPLLPQNTCTAALFIPSSFKISSGLAYSVKVTTMDGAVFVFSCIAGKTSGSSG